MAEESTLSLNTYHRLGVKTLQIFILQQSLASFALLLVWLFLVFFGNAILPSSVHSYLGLADIFIFSLFLIFVAFGTGLAFLNYYTYKFMMADHAFKITKGILNKEEVNIPYRQIQNINIHRDLASRILGVSRITILTAGFEDKSDDSESEGILPVMDYALAEQIQAELLRRAAAERQ